ncbi:hypothetical protein BJ165DRAFT_1410084 [Panaeolus papilionaceus]|nr:hypothetical protein BJ165DRAFT_1410084 [Panaeolus papilionaceus]
MLMVMSAINVILIDLPVEVLAQMTCNQQKQSSRVLASVGVLQAGDTGSTRSHKDVCPHGVERSSLSGKQSLSDIVKKQNNVYTFALPLTSWVICPGRHYDFWFSSSQPLFHFETSRLVRFINRNVTIRYDGSRVKLFNEWSDAIASPFIVVDQSCVIGFPTKLADPTRTVTFTEPLFLREAVVLASMDGGATQRISLRDTSQAFLNNTGAAPRYAVALSRVVLRWPSLPYDDHALEITLDPNVKITAEDLAPDDLSPAPSTSGSSTAISGPQAIDILCIGHFVVFFNFTHCDHFPSFQLKPADHRLSPTNKTNNHLNRSQWYNHAIPFQQGCTLPLLSSRISLSMLSHETRKTTEPVVHDSGNPLNPHSENHNTGSPFTKGLDALGHEHGPTHLSSGHAGDLATWRIFPNSQSVAPPHDTRKEGRLLVGGSGPAALPTWMEREDEGGGDVIVTKCDEAFAQSERENGVIELRWDPWENNTRWTAWV